MTTTGWDVPALGSPVLRHLDARLCGAMALVGGAVASLGALEAGRSWAVLAPLVATAVVAAPFLRWPTRIPRWALSANLALAAVGIVHTAVGTGTVADPGTAPIMLVLLVLHAGSLRSRRETWALAAWALGVYGAALWWLPATSPFGLRTWVTVAVALALLAAAVTWFRARIDDCVRELTHRAEHDALTGLLNRQGLVPRLRGQGASPRAGSLLLLDVDHFKRVNDEHGHLVGDDVLAWLGRLLADLFPAPALVARSGGEEFLVHLPGADLPGALVRAERLRRAVSDGSGQRSVAVTVSVGVAHTDGSTGAEDLYRLADQALYAAKHNGRDRVEAAGVPARAWGAAGRGEPQVRKSSPTVPR